MRQLKHKLYTAVLAQGKDLEGSFRYPLARFGVFAPGGRASLAHARQKVSYIVGLAAPRLAFVRRYK